LSTTLPEGFKIIDEPVTKLPEGFKLIDEPATPPPEGFKLIETPLSKKTKGPDEVPNPYEQLKIYQMLESMPIEAATEVKKKAIEKQREEKFGTISMEDPNLFRSVVKGAKNIPENIRDIVNETASLIMNVGRMGYNFTNNYIDDINKTLNEDGWGAFWRGETEFTKTKEQAKPLTDLVAATKSDWESIIKGENPEELSKLPSGKAIQQVFSDVESQGLRRYTYKLIENRPVDMMLIGTAVKSAAGQGIRLTAQGTRKVAKNGTKFADKLDNFVSTERKPIVHKMPVETDGTVSTAKTVEFPRQYSKDPLTKYIFQGSFDAAMDKFPKFRAAVANAKANKVINNMRNAYQEKGFRERSLLHAEIAKNIETLSPDELKVLVPYLEGRASLITNPSNEFVAFEKYYRNLSSKISEELSAAGKLDVDTIRDRMYQPIAMATGQSVEQVITEFGDFIPAYVHHMFPDKYPTKGSTFFPNTDVKRVNPSFLKKSKGYFGYSENPGEILTKWTAEYVRFKNTEAFIKDFTSKFGVKVNIKDVEGSGGVLKVGDKTYNGYRIIAPDGYLSFYQQKIDFHKEVSNRMKDMTFDEAIGDVVSETVTRTATGGGQSRQAILVENRVKEALVSRGFAPGEVTQMLERIKSGEAGSVEIVRERLVKSGATPEQIAEAFRGVEKISVGVAKNKTVYLVPESQAKQLESFATPIFGSHKAQNIIKIVYDRPQQIWKDSVLSTSPRWIKNNVMGDIIFNSMEGVGPISYGRAFQKKYTATVPDSVQRLSFANVMKYNPKLGSAAKSTVGRMIQRLDETKTVKGIAKVKDAGYALNTMFEQPFVRALYISEARKKAVSMLRAEKIPVTEANVIDRMNVIRDVPKLSDPIIKKVKETLPVFDLTGTFERKYLKRYIPFYNWFKFMGQYGAKLPAKHPFKTVGGRGLGALSENEREEAFVQTFPHMQDEIEGSGIPNRYDGLWPLSIDKEREALFFNSRGLNVFNTIEDIIDLKIGNMISPLVKVPVEQVTGRELWSGRKYADPDEGVDFQEFKKTSPPLIDHVLKQFPHYALLRDSLTPAIQSDKGTLLNPDPILDKITGEYKYPIESLEKILNFIGIDRKTLDMRKSWEQFQNKKRAAISKTFKHYQSKKDTALSSSEIEILFNEIKKNPTKYKKIMQEIKRKMKLKGSEKIELRNKIRR